MALAVRAIAGVFALSWLVLPGFGVIDLAVTWSSEWPQVLEAGWGLFSTVIVATAFVVLVVRPRASRRVAPQLVAATVALVVSAVVAREPGLAWFAALLGVEVAIVVGLSERLRRDDAEPVVRIELSRPLFALAVVGAVPWLTYALAMWARNRESRIDADITIGVDHYSMQGALALSFVLLSFLAALLSDARLFTAACVGVAASYLGVASLAWQDAAGGFDSSWSVAAIVWGAAVAVAAPATSRSSRSRGG